MKNKNVTNYFRKQVKTMGMTQTEIAKQAGITQAYLSNLVAGRSSVSTKTISAFCEAFDLDATKLINAKVKDYKASLINDLSL